MTLDQAAIRRILPHQGAMCVLDAVTACDAQQIVCRATGHRDPLHPMRGPRGLGSACGIEFAAQAMALHAAMTMAGSGGGPLPAGRLASVRDVVFAVDRLDDIDDDLQIRAALLSGDPRSAIYAFEIGAAGRRLISGRASVLIRPAGGPEDGRASGTA
ncbi:MAG TPA: 3-hydroxylacyl-ACP dehydratase [Burkholderiaceae bacterium]|nr:3-hydroxylacyl-ACP dehydratase [Burkholderiaceae bacterium]